MRLFGQCLGLWCDEHPNDYAHQFAVATVTIWTLTIVSVVLGIAIPLVFLL